MAAKLTAAMPEGMEVGQLFVIEWAALDPATGADVAGVVVSDVGMLVTQLSTDDPGELAVGPFMLVPGPGA